MSRRKEVEQIKRNYPAGARIRMRSAMNDVQGIEKGTEGVVAYVDDIGTIHMKWDNGRTLGIVPEVDDFEVI